MKRYENNNLLVPSFSRQKKTNNRFPPRSITHHTSIGDENQFQVFTAGQEKFEETPNSSAQEVSFSLKEGKSDWKSAAIHKERKY